MGAREQAATGEDSVLWTLEEISRLVSQTGNPAETLTNIVHLIQRRFETDVCSVYLLEADRASLVLAATIGLRPESVGRVRMRLTEGLVGLVAEQLRPQVLPDATTHPRFKYFREAGEDPYHSFLGVPIIDRGLLQGVLVVQTVEPPRVQPGRRADADDGRRAAGADRQRGAHARPGRRARASAALGAGAEPVVELGRRHDEPVPRARSRALARVRSQPDRAAPADADRRARRARVRSWRCTAASTTPTAACRSTCSSTHTWGDRHAGVLWARPVAYFSAEFGLHESLPIYSGGLGILAGDHIKSASDLGIPLVGVGLYYDQGYFRQRLDCDGWQHEDYLDVDSRAAADPAGHRRDGAPVTVSHRDAHRHDRRAGLDS